jgi:hypothetical protein
MLDVNTQIKTINLRTYQREERLVIRLRVTDLLRMAGQQIVEAEGRKEAGSIPRTALRFGGIEFPNKCTKKMLGENSLS